MEEIDDEILQDLYTWVDHIPLSRPKRNMARDFSDAVMCAEVLAHHFPKMVELHNYVPASSTKQKEENWRLLNRKVLRKLNMELSEDVVRSLAISRPCTIERVLLILRSKIDRTIYEKQRSEEHRHQYSDRPEVDQPPTKHPEASPGRKPGPHGKPGNLNNNLPIQAHLTNQFTSRPAPSPAPSKRVSPAPSDPKFEQHKSPLKSFLVAPNPQRRVSPEKLPTKKNIGSAVKPIPKTDGKVLAPLRCHKTLPREKPATIWPSGGPAGDMSIPVPELRPRGKISAREAKEFTSDYTSRLAYEEKAQECLAKEETIEILNAKVRRLEHLVHLKDIRIEDLQCRLEVLRPTNKHQ